MKLQAIPDVGIFSPTAAAGASPAKAKASFPSEAQCAAYAFRSRRWSTTFRCRSKHWVWQQHVR